MAKRKNYTPEQLHTIRVEAGRKSWETKVERMAIDPDYSRRIQLGQQKGLYRAKMKRKDPEGFYEFKKREEEWQKSHNYTPNTSYSPPINEIGNEEDILEDFLSTSIETSNQKAIDYLNKLRDEEREYYLDLYEDEDEALRNYHRDLIDRIEGKESIISEAINAVYQESKDAIVLQQSIYELARLIVGTLTPNMLADIEDLVDELIPIQFRGRKSK